MPESSTHCWVHAVDVLFRVLLIAILWQIPGPQGAEGHFSNTGQHGGGKDLLQNLRDVPGIHGNERPASW